MDKISIILPVFNDENLIEKSINSILNQTYQNFELIVINDGSTDNSLEKIQNYSDDRIIVYSQERKGTGQARNTGLKKATGNFICFVDSDDTINNNFLETMYNLIISNNAQIACCSYKKDTRKICNLNKEKGLKYLISLPEKIPMSVCGKLFRKETIEELWFDKNNHFEDIEFIIKAFARSEKVVYIERVMYNYVQRGNSRSKFFKSNDRMTACINNIKLIEQDFPRLLDSYITYTLFNTIAIANRMILNNQYDEKLLKDIKTFIRKNIKRVKKSQYVLWKKAQIYLFDWDFTIYRGIYLFFKNIKN